MKLKGVVEFYTTKNSDILFLQEIQENLMSIGKMYYN